MMEPGGTVSGVLHATGALISAVQRERGQFVDAIATLQHAQDLAHELDNPVREAYALLELGQTQLAGELDEDALLSFHQAAVLYRRLGDTGREAIAFDGTGEVYRKLGRLDQSADFHRRAVAGHRRRDDRWQLAISLDHLAATLAMAGQPNHARRHWTEALTLLAAFSDTNAGAPKNTIRDRLHRSSDSWGGTARVSKRERFHYAPTRLATLVEVPKAVEYPFHEFGRGYVAHGQFAVVNHEQAQIDDIAEQYPRHAQRDVECGRNLGGGTRDSAEQTDLLVVGLKLGVVEVNRERDRHQRLQAQIIFGLGPPARACIGPHSGEGVRNQELTVVRRRLLGGCLGFRAGIVRDGHGVRFHCGHKLIGVIDFTRPTGLDGRFHHGPIGFGGLCRGCLGGAGFRGGGHLAGYSVDSDRDTVELFPGLEVMVGPLLVVVPAPVQWWQAGALAPLRLSDHDQPLLGVSAPERGDFGPDRTIGVVSRFG